MKKFVDWFFKKVVRIAESAAVFSAGTASCGGMYEPKRPEIKKWDDIVNVR